MEEDKRQKGAKRRAEKEASEERRRSEEVKRGRQVQVERSEGKYCLRVNINEKKKKKENASSASCGTHFRRTDVPTLTLMFES